MSLVVEIKNKEALAPLFRENRYDTVLLNGVLEGYFGRVCADSITHPSVARLDSGAFTILGGDARAPATTALLRHTPISFVTPENSAWREVLRTEFGDKLSILPFTEFTAQFLDDNHLARLVQTLPADFEIVKIDVRWAEQLPSDLSNEYFFENFETLEDFLQRGIGYCVVYKRRIVSAATSMAMCNGAIDIEIETASELRRRGLGTCVGAQLVLDCLRNGIEPKWLAANLESENLALKLGYMKGETYQTFEVEHDT